MDICLEMSLEISLKVLYNYISVSGNPNKMTHAHLHKNYGTVHFDVTSIVQKLHSSYGENHNCGKAEKKLFFATISAMFLERILVVKLI